MKQIEPIAIVGLSGVFPGANSLDKYWGNIVNGISSISDVPEDRWIVKPDSVLSSTVAQDKVLSKKAGLINNFSFDPNGLNIKQNLLLQLDPMFHILLTAGKEALAECSVNDNIKKRTGVILAAIALPTDSSSSFTRKILGKNIEQQLFGAKVKRDKHKISKEEVLASRVTSLPASILAKSLNLGGGSYTLDAACSSSLYSIKLACDELRSKKRDMMIAGGVSRPESLFTQTGFSQLTALSPSGICSPFDRSADGLVVGEGAGIIVLKRLEDALKHNDTIHGLLYGAGLTNDIGGNLLAPDTRGQVRAMKLAYQNSGWSPNDIDHVECHGTGTPVGDKIELQSLRTVWGESGWRKHQCAIGSVKSMIGHLLTAAGIAGTIKTILALKNKTIPPSLNFTGPANGSPLENGPFFVPTEAKEWKRNASRPRRAAMSAFGFGGINAHLLIEEWNDKAKKTFTAPQSHKQAVRCDIAITGMATYLNNSKTLKDFQLSVLNGRSQITDIVGEWKWRGCEETALNMSDMNALPDGNYFDSFDIAINEFHIPPIEIPDILPQHLLMLKAASAAIEDAGIEKRSEKPRMGSAIGMNFDFEATNFNIRWNHVNDIEKWNRLYQLDLTENEKENWLNELHKESIQPLTPAKTTGALGGIIASRVAKEFKLGGPSFIVSSEDTSGLKALEIGIQSIQNDETDTYIAGAVDLPGEIRNLVASNCLRPFSTDNKPTPFDSHANGSLPGEGAVAVVLKRLDKAVEDGDRVYAVIKGTGSASAGGIDENVSENVYTSSLERAFENSGISVDAVSYIETHGSAQPNEDQIEAAGLNQFFSKSDALKNRIALGSVIPVTGHLGAAYGLTSVIKASLCIFQEILPPLPNYKSQPDNFLREDFFHIPIFPQYWMRNKIDGPRTACVASMTTEGNCSHVLLQSFENQSNSVENKIEMERRSPLGNGTHGLFILEGDSEQELLIAIDQLRFFIEKDYENPESQNLNEISTLWHTKNRAVFTSKKCISIIASSTDRLKQWIKEAEMIVKKGIKSSFNGPDGICYSPTPIGPDAEIGFVYPGSGNHYIGMGKDIGTYWPEIFRKLDDKTGRLKSQLLPDYFSPYNLTWPSNWETSALANVDSNPHATITAQVAHGILQTELLRKLNLTPSSVISYSLGESAGYFATDTWTERDVMHSRMENSSLFKEKLTGACTSARQAWGIPDDEEFNWKVAFVNKSKDEVEKGITGLKYVKLLIINTPDECVVGGREAEVRELIEKLKCPLIYINGVVTVHSDAAKPVAEEYRNLHLLKTTPPKDIKFYSCYSGKQYKVTRESAADSVLNQALYGFNFPKIITNAYNEGTRIFIEAGPGSSCSRMIEKILPGKSILSISTCIKGEDKRLTLLKLAGSIAAERIPFSTDLIFSYSDNIKNSNISNITNKIKMINIVVGYRPPILQPPPSKEHCQFTNQPTDRLKNNQILSKRKNNLTVPPVKKKHEKRPVTLNKKSVSAKNPSVIAMNDVIKSFTENNKKTAETHNKFIEFSSNISKSFAETVNIQSDMIEKSIRSGDRNLINDLKINKPFVADRKQPDSLQNNSQPQASLPGYSKEVEILAPVPVEKKLRPEPAFSREMCMEFAIGSIEKVLGPQFAAVDTYDVRVRLPDEPLMLVDRILTVEGEIGSLKSGKVVTEHDVLPDAWYLDGGKAPVCISIEAGQADLFLCSYLGIDLAVKGKRSYRLLDAVAQFHGGLPEPGDTVRYEIEIDRFINQGETYLFFFHFNGFLGKKHIISMRNGCAGFFTQKEVNESGGIVLTQEETAPVPGTKTPAWKDLVSFFDTNTIYEFDDEKVNALRNGDAEKAFGPLFKGKKISKSMAIPAGRMKLVDRVLSLDPSGGRYGLGQIKAQADIKPDAWFLTCHFVDDMVMPGTLMYECCMHTLRIFTMRMGWISDKETVCCEPVPEVKSVLKCRGPVTIETKHVFYVIDIKEIGYNPEPYVIADAHMYAHDEHIVMFRDMSMKLSGITQTEIEQSWE